MCFGGGSPSVQYTGPSADDVAAAQANLEQYRNQVNNQQAAMADQLNRQIAAANEETERVKSEFAAEQAAAQAASAAAQAAAYSTSTQMTDEMPEGAQTTISTKKKSDKKNTLKINTGSSLAQAGAGLNIGV